MALTKCILPADLANQLTVFQAPNDANGNPRYIIDHSLFLTAKDREQLGIKSGYDLAVGRCKLRFGGKRFHNKQYGGGIAIVSYNLESDLREILAYMKLFN